MVAFFCISHIIQLAPQQQSAEPRNSAGAEALADRTYFFSFPFQLWLSRAGKTGYLSVHTSYNKFRIAVYSTLDDNQKVQSRVTGFDTAVAAALWYAKFLAGENPKTPQGGLFEIPGEFTPPQRQAAAPAAAAAALHGSHSANCTAAAPTTVRPLV